MTQRERFLAVVNGEKPDYYPIFGIDEAPGFSGGVMRQGYDNLLKTGMPDIGGVWEEDGNCINQQGWRDFWGVCGPVDVNEFPGDAPEPLKWETRIVGDFEIVTCETGACQKQVKKNSITYSMPEFVSYHVQDRESWEYYKSRRTASNPYSKEKLESMVKKYEASEKPLRVSLCSTFGTLRDIVGPEEACMLFYDDPELVHEILGWLREENRNFWFPLIERLKPDIVSISEDICYKQGMFISPDMFNEFCGPAYIEAGEIVKKADVPLFVVDTDGFAEPFIPVASKFGVNGIFPWEVKSDNDLFRVREQYPEFVIMGGIEKEIANLGNEGLIYDEIMGKVPGLIKKGFYFPNGDHGVQPLATFENLCKTMTLLHEVCENDEGSFPRVK